MSKSLDIHPPIESQCAFQIHWLEVVSLKFQCRLDLDLSISLTQIQWGVIASASLRK